jgi:hypothetical protein
MGNCSSHKLACRKVLFSKINNNNYIFSSKDTNYGQRRATEHLPIVLVFPHTIEELKKNNVLQEDKKKTLTTQYNLFYRFFQANMCKSLNFCLICNKLYAYGTFSLVGEKYMSFDIGCFTLK